MDIEERLAHIEKYSNGVERIAHEAERLMDKRALELADGDATTAFLLLGRVQLKLFRNFFHLALITGARTQDEKEKAAQ